MYMGQWESWVSWDKNCLGDMWVESTHCKFIVATSRLGYNLSQDLPDKQMQVPTKSYATLLGTPQLNGLHGYQWMRILIKVFCRAFKQFCSVCFRTGMIILILARCKGLMTSAPNICDTVHWIGNGMQDARVSKSSKLLRTILLHWLSWFPNKLYEIHNPRRLVIYWAILPLFHALIVNFLQGKQATILKLQIHWWQKIISENLILPMGIRV